MIAITLEEKKKILEQFPDTPIVRTMRQRSSRHRYFMEERSGPMRLLRRLRGNEPKQKRQNSGRT